MLAQKFAMSLKVQQKPATALLHVIAAIAVILQLITNKLLLAIVLMVQ
jgi:hypothetical protein